MFRRDLRPTETDRLLATCIVTDNAVQARPEPGGDRIAYARTRENRTDLWLTDPDGPGDGRRLTAEGVHAAPPVYPMHNADWFDWGPAGERIAYASEATGSVDLWTVDVETGEQTHVTHHAPPDDYPRFSPTGEELACVSYHRSPSSIGVASADGRGFETLIEDDFVYTDPQWADAGTLYAVRARHRDLFGRETQLVRITRAGDLEVLYAPERTTVLAPRPRPGGDAIAFLSDETGYDGLYLHEPGADAPTAVFTPEAAEVRQPAWDAAGERLVTGVVDDGDVQLYAVTPDGDAERLTDAPGRRHYPAWHGDDVVCVTGTPTEPFGVRNETAGASVTHGSPVGLAGRLIEPEGVRYESTDGTSVHAMVYPPPGIEDAAPGSTPVVVHPHGGPAAYYGFDFNPFAQYFAAQGYAVIEPNYRGSAGFGRSFRNANDHAWGEGDLEDVTASIDYLEDAYPAVDGDRAGIFGGSGGGLMTVNALGRTDRFDAGAAFYGVFDYETFVDDTDDIGFQLMKRELGFPATHRENYRAASPIEAVPDIEAPVLVLHGEDDARVPISQSEQLVEALERHGKPHEFVRYEDERHVLTRREHVMDAYTRVADLFAKYLKTDPDDGGSVPHAADEERFSAVPLSPFGHFH